MPNKIQIQTTLTPLIIAAAAWLALKFPLIDQATWTALVTAVAMTAATGLIGFITKRANLADTVAPKNGNTTIVTDTHTANSLPANDRVVSSADFTVVKK